MKNVKNPLAISIRLCYNDKRLKGLFVPFLPFYKFYLFRSESKVGA